MRAAHISHATGIFHIAQRYFTRPQEYFTAALRPPSPPCEIGTKLAVAVSLRFFISGGAGAKPPLPRPGPDATASGINPLIIPSLPPGDWAHGRQTENIKIFILPPAGVQGAEPPGGHVRFMRYIRLLLGVLSVRVMPSRSVAPGMVMVSPVSAFSSM